MKPYDDRRSHWDSYYSTRSAPSIPSQFAVFVCDYLQAGQNVVELGCGDGRDSFFFASQGYRTLALDASERAISLCRGELAQRRGLHAEFERLQLQQGWSDAQIEAAAQSLTGRLDADRPTSVYARFFLHAITEEEEGTFLRLAAAVVRDGHCAVEFRTHRDFYLTKETPPHYRRYIDPLEFHARAAQAGFAPVYFVEGFGFAKYKSDDAHIARSVLAKAAGGPARGTLRAAAPRGK